MEKSNNVGQVVGALLIGAALGGIAGVLFAPNKGSDTRRKIMDNGEDIADAVKDKLNDFLEEVKKEVEVVKTKANEMLEAAVAQVDHVKSNK